MNSLFVVLGIEAWKPVLTALMLPPAPLLILVLIGARLILPRRGLGWFLILLGVAGLWFSMCTGTGRAIEQYVVHVPAPLTRERVAALKAGTKATPATTAIVVLGGGLEPFAPEYGVSNLAFHSLERLRYGMWLAHETGLPVAYTGGAGWAQRQGSSEAEAAARIAAQDFNRPLRWTESESRDTRENAARTLPLLKRAGVTHVLLVTHGWHMPRALRAFEEAAQGNGITIEAAPMGLATRADMPALDWLPSGLGYLRVRNGLREGLGRLMGA